MNPTIILALGGILPILRFVFPKAGQKIFPNQLLIASSLYFI